MLDVVAGVNAVRFDIPELSGSNAAGTWWTNFAPDLRRFGENTEFFVQWRQRYNQAFMDTIFMANATVGGGYQGGCKLVDVVTGDTPTRIWNTCEALEIVVQTYYTHKFPIVYNSCTGSGTHGPYSGFTERQGSIDFLLQIGRPEPGCKYSQTTAMNKAGQFTATPPGGFGLVADQWMTFQMGVTVGPRNNVTNDFDHSRVRLWGAHEGQPSELILDWNETSSGYFPLAAGPLDQDQQYGKIWFMPYMTNKDPLQRHPLCQAWYAEPIISTQKIPDAL